MRVSIMHCTSADVEGRGTQEEREILGEWRRKAEIALTKADDDVPRKEGHVREEDERAADADHADEAEDGDAQEEVERDLARVVRSAQRAPVLVEDHRDVYCARW